MADNIQFRVDAVLGDTSQLQQQINNLRTNLNLTINNTQALQSIQTVQQQINSLQQSMNNMNFNFGGNGGGSSGQNNSSNVNIPTVNQNALASINQARAEMANLGAESVKIVSVNGQIKSSTYEINDGYNKLNATIKSSGDQVDRLKVESDSLRQKLDWVVGDVKETGVKDMSDLSNTNWFKNLGDNAKIVGGISRSLNSYHQQIEKTTVRVKTSDNTWQKYNVTLNKTTGELRVLKGQTSDVINSQMNLSTMLKSAIERFAVWGVAMKVWTTLGSAIQDCTNYVKDLDGAMTNIRVVTMDTKEATQELLETYNQLGQELGANTLDIADGAVDWLRQGYSQADTTELVKDSTILSKLALIDNTQATEYLTSALKGYKLEAKDAIGVIDQLVSIDLEAATSAGDMAEAMSRTANMAKTTGFEMNELLGVIATVSEVTQNSASTVGNSMKTLLSRMSNVKAGVEIDSETGEALNDVEKVLNRVGIALRDNQGNWYDFYDVLDQIASRWSEFSDIQKSQITTALGGTRQRENVLVMLENWDKVKQYAQTGAEASGTAMEKYDIVLESVSAKQEQLNAKVQEFYMNLIGSGLLTVLLDLANGLMNIVNAGDSFVGKLALLIAGFTALNFVIQSNSLSSFRTVLTEVGQSIRTVITAIPQWIAGLNAQRTAQDAVNASTATGNALAMANPWLAIAEIAIMAIMGIKMAIDAHNETIQESIEKADELRETYKSTNEELSNSLKTLTETTSTTASGKQYKSLSDEFADLCKGVDAYGNNLSLTNEKYERYKSICGQIIGLNPDLMDGYDSEIEAIGNRNGLLQDTIDLLQQEARERAKAYADSSGDTLEGAKNKYDKDTSADKTLLESYKNSWNNDTEVSGSNLLEVLSSYQLGYLADLSSVTDKTIDEVVENWTSVKKELEDVKQTIINSDEYNNLDSRSQQNVITAIDRYITHIEETYVNGYNEASETIANAQDELANSMNETWKAVLQSSEEYSDLDSGTRSWLNQYIIDNFKIDENTKEETVNEYKKTILDILNSISGDTTEAENARKSLSELFTLNPDDISYDDYKDKVEEVVGLITTLTGQNSKKIKISLGFDVDNTEDLEGLDEIAETLAAKFSTSVEDIEDKLGDMSKASVDALLDMDESTLQNCKSWDDLKVAIANVVSDVEDMDKVFSNYATDIQSLSEKYEILSKAQEEYNEYGNITASTMKKIIDNGLLEYLTAENGQLQFNTQALQDNANATQNSAIAKLQEALFTDLQSIALGTYQETVDATNSDNANAELQAFQSELGNTTTKALETATAISAVNSALGTDYQFSDKQKAQADAVVANYNAMVSKVKAISTNLSTGSYRSKSKSSGSSSKSSKEWWETALEELKDNLDYNAITLDTYINGVQNILNKLKKGSDAWKEVNKELQDAKLDRLKNQFDRGEITIDQYIKGLEKLRKAYKKNTEGYKELTQTINETKADKFADQYERGEISLNSYVKQLIKLRNCYKKNSEEWKKYNDLISDVKFDNYLDNLEKGLDNINNAIDRLGDVNTAKEESKYATLLSKKYKLIKNDVVDIQKQLKSSNLTYEQRVKLQDKLNDLLKEEVSIRDEIEDRVKEYYENQKEQLEQQAELKKKQTLYDKEVELYGSDGKDLWEYYQDKKIKALQDELDLDDKISEEQELQNNLLEAKLKLQNALNNKTTKILTKQDDGTWAYTFSSNMADVKEATKELADAQKAVADSQLQKQIDALEKEKEEKQNAYDEAEFWANRDYEKQMNSIAESLGDIDKLVQDWMSKYGTNTNAYQKLVSANNKLEQSIIDLTTAIESKYETVGNNGLINTKNGVTSFDTGGDIKGNGLAFVHDKERVLTQSQNSDFTKLIKNIDSLNKLVDISKITIPNYKNFAKDFNSNATSVIHINGVTCNFPAVTSPDGIQKAILELPRLALQRKK